jgi:hypothetical protein
MLSLLFVDFVSLLVNFVHLFVDLVDSFVVFLTSLFLQTFHFTRGKQKNNEHPPNNNELIERFDERRPEFHGSNLQIHQQRRKNNE